MQKLLDDMADELQELLTRSEVLGEQGDVDGSQVAAAQAEAIKVASSICILPIRVQRRYHWVMHSPLERCTQSLTCGRWELAGSKGENRGGPEEWHWRQPLRHAGGVPPERRHHQQRGKPHPRPQEWSQLPVRCCCPYLFLSTYLPNGETPFMQSLYMRCWTS